MKIVVIGDGKVGYKVTQELSAEGHDLTIIDNKKSVLMEAVEKLDVMVVHGHGASLKVQKEADVENSDLLIAVTSSDELNILCCVVARKQGLRHTIARVRNPEYDEQLQFLREDMGLSMVVNPEYTAAREIYRLLQFPSFLKRDSFAKGRVEIVELELREGNPLIGRQLMDLISITGVRVLVCAVERDDTAYIPNGSFRLQKGDRLYVTAATNELAGLIKSLGLTNRKVKDIMIIGGSRIAYYLAGHLLCAGIHVKLVEINEQRCQELSELLPRASVLCMDGTDRTSLMSEGIDTMDAVVTLTDMDEENLIVSMYANYLGVPKVITKINRTEYNEVFRDKGIDCVISPKELAAYSIVRYVRAMENTEDNSVITLHKLANDKAEALEFRVTETTKHVGKMLKDIELKSNILIACINRGGKIHIPKGDDMMQLRDTVIIVAQSERIVNDLNDIFKS